MMAALINYVPEKGYRSIENFNLGANTTNQSVQSQSEYRPVNIYTIRSDVMEDNEKQSVFGCFRRCCFCCVTKSSDANDSPLDGSSSALVGHVGRSYTLNNDQLHEQRPAPIVTVTRVIDNDSVNSSQLLLDSEKSACINYKKIKINESKGSQSNSPYDSGNNSGSSTLRTGEKVSFIREILNCRDTFVRSLEWCDNSLTRGKKYRFIKRDDWLGDKEDGIQETVDFIKHALRNYLLHSKIKFT